MGAVTELVNKQAVADAFSRAGLIPKPLKVAEAVWQPGSSIA